MKKLILHVGFHKTATSSIQHTLTENTQVLDECGYIYPLFYNNERRILNHSISIYSAFCENPASYHINIRNGDLERLDDLNKSYMLQLSGFLKLDKNIILSGEDISTLSYDSLLNLKKFILSYGFKLEVFCSVRKAYSLTCSELQEQIKNGR